MSVKLFDHEVAYRRPEIKAKLGKPSDRTLDVILRERPFLSVNETCTRYNFARSTFYRMLADPHSGLDELVVRIPPGSGRIKVPTRAFEEWLARGRCLRTKVIQLESREP
jgi:predicted DNA-binding transcriptional regulator AlpA